MRCVRSPSWCAISTRRSITGLGPSVSVRSSCSGISSPTCIAIVEAVAGAAISIALGFSGEFQVEIIQQHDEHPSAYRDFLQQYATE